MNLAFLTKVSKRWNIAYALGYQRFLGDAADSPVVDDEGSAIWGDHRLNYPLVLAPSTGAGFS